MAPDRGQLRAMVRKDMELFKEYVKANDMNLSDFPVDEDLDIIELNKVLEDNFEELKDVYEGE